MAQSKLPVIRKAVFPVAGLGTRMLPATKSIPKEMLSIVDRPAIQLVVDEAREAGIEQFIFVTGRNKSAIEDYFDRNFELDSTLLSGGKSVLQDSTNRSLIGAGQAIFTRQQNALGLGHAVWCARHIVGDEPFALLLPDMLMRSSPGCLKQMMETYRVRGGGNVISLEEVPWTDVVKYGVVGFRPHEHGTMAINRMVEKPTLEDAPSNLIISGRYILQPEIFRKIASTNPDVRGEIQLTDAMGALMVEQRFWGHSFSGTTFDCGDKLGYLLANLAYGLAHKEIGVLFQKAVAAQLKQLEVLNDELNYFAPNKVA